MESQETVVLWAAALTAISFDGGGTYDSTESALFVNSFWTMRRCLMGIRDTIHCRPWPFTRSRRLHIVSKR